MKHFKSLDACRALAVLAVMAFHALYLPCGWIGVQVFFVLSGFLITGILLQQKTADLKPYLSRFYWRRALRIWPLYFLYVGILGLIYGNTGKPALFGEQWLSVVTFTFNFQRALDFTAWVHLWSLSVEEQFYLVWPFVVFFAPLPLFRRLLVGLLLAGPLIRFAAGVVFAPAMPDAFHLGHLVYTFSPSHFDAFAAGAVLCVLPDSWHNAWQKRSALIAGLLLGTVVVAGLMQLAATRAHRLDDILALGYPIHTSQFHQYVWAYSLLNACSAALIFHLVSQAATPRAAPSRLFDNPALVYIGKISYGVYVWHLAVLKLFEHLWPAWQVHRLSPRGLAYLAAYLLVTLALASFSFFCFERLFLRWKDLIAPQREPLEAAPARVSSA